MSIYIAYHYPCMDGAYSAMVSFLALKSQINQKYSMEQVIEIVLSKIKQRETQEEEELTFEQNKSQQMEQEICEKSSIQSTFFTKNKEEEICKNAEQIQKIDSQEQNTEMSQEKPDSQQNIPFKIESDENKPYFYTDQFSGIRFIPYVHSIKSGNNGNNNATKNKKGKKAKQHHQQSQQHCSDYNAENPFIQKIKQINSGLNNQNHQNGQQQQYPKLDECILFILDFSLPLADLYFLAQKFKKVIVLDHHIHFENTIEEIQQKRKLIHTEKSEIPSKIDASIQPSKLENQCNEIASEQTPVVEKEEVDLLKKIYFEYDISLSGCTITDRFFENCLNYKLKLPASIVEKINEQCIYIQDYDIKSKRHQDSEAFVAGLYTKSIQLNAKKNPLLFYEFLSLSSSMTIERGKKILEQNKVEVQRIMSKHKQIVYLGGKHGPVAKCYCIYTKNHSIYNELGALLSLASLAQGLDHMGIVYTESSQDKNFFKVSLRASLEHEGKCNEVAGKFGGGGHQRAASFFINKNQFKKWLQ